MARSLIKLGSIVLAAGVILGACIGAAIFRAATYHNPDLIRIPSGIQPEFGIAIAAFIVALGEAQGLAKFFAVSGGNVSNCMDAPTNETGTAITMESSTEIHSTLPLT